MREFHYKKVDAFTSGNSYGNPAAVLYLEEAQHLSAQEMQEIAKLHKGFVSEVVFCKSTGNCEYALCYYSSEREVDFCGHGTIACMYSLIKNSPRLSAEQKITIHTARKGSLTVYNKIAEQDAVYITAPLPEYFECSLSRKVIADSLGLEQEKVAIGSSGLSQDKIVIGSSELSQEKIAIASSGLSQDKIAIDSSGLSQYKIEIDFSKLSKEKISTGRIEIVNAGLTTLIVPLVSLQEETTVFPDEQKLKGFCQENHIDIILIYSLEVQDKKHHAHTRVFAPIFGYLEDPATGSGNSAFGYYMLKHGLWDGRAISIEQGGCDRIYNVVKLICTDNQVLFGGSATERIVGNYLITE